MCGGEEPSEADATVFGFVVAVLVCDAYVISPHLTNSFYPGKGLGRKLICCNRGPESRNLVKGCPTIVEYARRTHDSFYLDFELWNR